MKAAIALIGCALVGALPVSSQTPQFIADGVAVLPVRTRADIPPQNAGWVELEDYLLVIDGVPGDSGSEVLEVARRSTGKPVRFALRTLGGPDDVSGANPEGLTWLSAVTADVVDAARSTDVAAPAGASAVPSGPVLRVPSGATLEDSGRRVELHHVDDRAGSALAVYVADSGVLFAGDLVGRGRSSTPLPIDAWIRSLERLERVDPRVVIPGRGRAEGPGVLEATRTALESLKGRVSEAIATGSSREQVLEAVGSDDFEVLPEGTVGEVFDELAGLRPATAFVEELGLREGPSPTAATPGWTRPTKVVVADFWPGRTAQIALVAPRIEVVVAANPSEASEAGQDADAILGWLTPRIFSEARNLRWVQLNAAGVEGYVAIPGFAESDIVLSNAQRIFGPGSAEHVLGMVLTLSRRLHTALELQRERRWDITPLTGPTPYTGAGSELLELRGRTLLVVGLGGIGTEVARVASGIGMRVIATRGSSRSGPPFVDYVGLSSELLTLAPEADVIVNSVPLTAATEKMFDDGFFEVTKPTAFFVNIGRGRTVDTDALVRALREGRIAGAGLDVTEPEPLPVDHELWGMPNVIITPHLGGDGDGHMERMWLLFRENLRRFVNGEPLLSVVDKRRGY
jgi:phosphoglycerate dehydrogenase-like enzyme/glyoxylase-like metal-dependent hydrolase (beta-lactamase superfamily II)